MKKVISIVLFTVLLIMGMFGCDGEEEHPLPSAVPTPKNNMETLTIYSINSDNATLIPVPVKKSTEKLSEKYIAALVLENLNEEEIIVDSVKQKGKKVILSFSSKGKPIQKCSEKMENLILECFANSLLDNVKGCSEVIFRCDGKAYKSKNQSFGLNEVYASE